MLLANINCQFLILNKSIQLKMHSKHCIKNTPFCFVLSVLKVWVSKEKEPTKEPSKACYTVRSPHLKGVKKNLTGVLDLQF